jgi:hypothetical protein
MRQIPQLSSFATHFQVATPVQSEKRKQLNSFVKVRLCTDSLLIVNFIIFIPCGTDFSAEYGKIIQILIVETS